MLCLSDALKPVIIFESCAENAADAATLHPGAGRRLIGTAVLETGIVVDASALEKDACRALPPLEAPNDASGQCGDDVGLHKPPTARCNG
jgi:hypothetical protein